MSHPAARWPLLSEPANSQLFRLWKCFHNRRPWLFAEAHGGTLLLDEIGEMPLSLQARLLRVLQEGMVKPVGSNQEEPVDVRILAATHVDLLAMNFLRESARRHQRGFLKLSEVSSRTLIDYPFPGNVRELASAIERAVTFCEGNTIQPDHLPERIRKRQGGAAGLKIARSGENMSEWPTLDNLQQGCAREVMRAVNGNKRRAAQILGINRRTLKRWLVAEESVENRSGGQNPENTRLKEPQGES